MTNTEMGALMVGLLVVTGAALCYDMSEPDDAEDLTATKTSAGMQPTDADGVDTSDPVSRPGYENGTDE